MDESAIKKKFGPLLVLSLVVAFLSPEALLGVGTIPSGIAVGLLLDTIWLGFVVFAIRRFGKRGLWLLFGLPFASVVPLVSLILAIDKR